MPNKVVDTFNHLVGIHGFDYNQITDEIFIGTNMCCQFGFSHELLSRDVRADISLEKERIDTPDGVDYFFWLPTEDKEAPDNDKLKMGVQIIDFLINHHIKTYIHCKNGHGRAPLLFASYLVSKGMSSEQAFKAIKEKRPSIHFTDVQLHALLEFESSLKIS